ncbi:hypothetical protein PsorP6_008379 [Peronosclerospora sorghi]|uniref:Uncharacterized protein n=1 Tax=Peronosclerospora sorghi TaxID=230839 RepID=A0ACC0W8W0_9STRA|nr:hypothetical protein PsorP6_008379 [Peronosclerospora sorghi]
MMHRDGTPGIRDAEIILRKRVGTVFVLGLVVASAVCVLLSDILGNEETVESYRNPLMHAAQPYLFSTPSLAATSAVGCKKNLEIYTNTTRRTGTTVDYEMAKFIGFVSSILGLKRLSSKMTSWTCSSVHQRRLTLDIFQPSCLHSICTEKRHCVSGATAYAHFGFSIDYEAMALHNVSVVGKIGLVRMWIAPKGPWRPSTATTFRNVYMGDGDPTLPEGF